MRTLADFMRRLAGQRVLAVTLVGLLAFGISAGLALVCPRPPAVHDEFSYLLAADTFAHGSLANPPHPMWVHFESFYVNVRPTYCSMYPPAQGLFLCVGQVLTGHALVGVWISMGLACAAVCWMLQAWMPARWALLGGLLAATHVSIQECWGHTYWGGAVAMLGGAMILGALRRITRQPHVCHSLVMGTGLALLANSRPFEGLIASLPVAVVLLVWMLGKSRPSWKVALGRVALPIVLVLSLTAGMMGFYNYRATGDPLLMPYMLYGKTYAVTPIFLWQACNSPPEFHHEAIRNHNANWALAQYEQCRRFPGLIWEPLRRCLVLESFYLGLLLPVPLLMLPWILRNPWMRFALLTCGLMIVALLQTVWLFPHYAAPATALVFALVVQGMRHLRLWHWKCFSGRLLVWTLLLFHFFFAGMMFVNHSKPDYNPRGLHPPWGRQRARIIERLEADDDRHLVIVRYRTDCLSGNEWVYNQADIDAAKVVWAREMDAPQNRKLIAYFADRRVWLLEADAESLQGVSENNFARLPSQIAPPGRAGLLPCQPVRPRPPGRGYGSRGRRGSWTSPRLVPYPMDRLADGALPGR